jgi:single-strand DNA-binding protein
VTNHITVVGNLTKDPELTFASNGNARVALNIASNHTYKSKANETVTSTTFFKVLVWDQLAENVAESLRKGDRITLNGRVQERSWTDEAQVKHWSYEILAQEVAASVRFRSVKVSRPVRQSVGLDSGDLPTNDGVDSCSGPEDVLNNDFTQDLIQREEAIAA